MTTTHNGTRMVMLMKNRSFTTDEDARLSLLTLVNQLFQDTAWAANAACKGTLDEPYAEGMTGSSATAAMRQFVQDRCAGCPVKFECLEAGLSNRFGVWGGLLPEERARVAAQRRHVPQG